MAKNTSESTTSTSNSKRPSSIKDALKVLDDALAGGSAGFNDIISDEYTNIKAALAEVTADASHSLRSAGDNLQELGTQALSAVSEYSERGLTVAMEGGREAWTYVDGQVRRNPWPAIGAVALGTFALGIAIAARRGANTEAGSIDSRRFH